MSITVANAPISYGAFELTVGIDPSTRMGSPSWTRSRHPDMPASTWVRWDTSAAVQTSGSGSRIASWD